MERYYVSLIIKTRVTVNPDTFEPDNDCGTVIDAIVDHDHVSNLNNTETLCYFRKRENAEACVAKIRAFIAECRAEGFSPRREIVQQFIDRHP